MGRQDSEAMAAFLADADSHRTRFAQESSGRPGVPWPYVLLEWQTADLPPTVRRVLVTTAANIAGLRRIVDRCGWPGRSLVGEDGADAAWLVLQHGASGIRTVGTPESVAFVRRCLPLLRRAVTTSAMSRACAEHRTERPWTPGGPLSACRRWPLTRDGARGEKR